MNPTAPLLLEIGCEDLPARYVMPLADALSAAITHGLGRRGVAIGAARTFATPRRIAVLVDDVADLTDGMVTRAQLLRRELPRVARETGEGRPAARPLSCRR